jgi:hypothetical protein
MENKSLFSILALTVTLIMGYFFYADKITKLESELQISMQKYKINPEVLATLPKITKKDTIKTKSKLQATAQTKYINPEILATASSKINQEIYLELESLSNQLIKSQSALRISKSKLSLSKSKNSVLNNEIARMNDARNKLKALEITLQSTEQKLKMSVEKEEYLENIFTKQNTQRAIKDIARIKALKETIGGVAITGLIAPIIGVATLISYTSEEIDNYCIDIKNIITFDKKVFNKVVSLNTETQQDYNNQCNTHLTDKIKNGLNSFKTLN